MMSYLKSYIKQQQDMRITYATFMEIALYHPQFGYYMKEKTKIGKDGDFYTSSNVHNVYGKLFANLFHRLCIEEQMPPVICEVGAGTGRFAEQVLSEWKESFPTFYEEVTYIIVETSPYHRKLQQERLPSDAKIVYYSSLEDVPPFKGVIFSNELFDALPVHVIVKKDGVLQEVFVSLEEEQLVEVFAPLQNRDIRQYLIYNGIELKEGQRFEVSLNMGSIIRTMSNCLLEGAIFTVDYGYRTEQWSEPEHRDGSLRGYYEHQIVTNPLLHVGEMDLTTHIDLDFFQKVGESYELHHVFTFNQGQFLLAAGILDFLQNNYDPNPFSETSKQNRAIRSLIMDSSLSNGFHVIVQQKNKNIHWDNLLQMNEQNIKNESDD